MLNESDSTRQFYGEKPGPSVPLSLSLLIAPGAFMYAISAQPTGAVAEIGHLRSAQPGSFAGDDAGQLAPAIQNFFLNRKGFERVNIAVLNRQFTLVPEAYGQEDLRSLLQFSSGEAEVKTASVHRIKGVNFCYSLGFGLSGYLERTFSNATIRHAGAVSLGLFFSHHALAPANVFMSVGDHCMELCIRENNELLFYNIFSCENNEDILYYLLFTMEQFKLDPQQVRLVLAAERPVDDALFKTLKRYIRQVSFAVSDPSVKLSGDLLQLPQHYYFTLLNQHLCGL